MSRPSRNRFHSSSSSERSHLLSERGELPSERSGVPSDRSGSPSKRSGVGLSKFGLLRSSKWALAAALALACSGGQDERDKESPMEPGELEPAPLVFPESPLGGGGSGSTSGSGGSGASGSTGGTGAGDAGSTPFGDDSFAQFIDPPRQISVYCGDGAYDPTLEECDDGIGAELDVCSPNCQTRDLLAVPAIAEGRFLSRRIGLGRHPISGGPLGSAVAWMDVSGAAQVVTQIRDAHGNRISEVVVADSTLVPEGASRPTTTSHPVLATLPDGTHVVAYNDLNGDGNELGVALRTVSHLTATVGEVRYANSTTIGAQYDPDLLWTSRGLVAAWVDTSDDLNGPDVRYRIYNEALEPVGAELTLASSELPEGAVTLAPSTGEAGFAAAWRRAEIDGSETIVVSRGAQRVEFRAALFGAAPHAEVDLGMGGAGPDEGVVRLMPGHMEDRLGLAPLGDNYYGVAFTVGTDPEETGVANVFRLWFAVVDLAEGTVPWIGPVAPLLADAPDETHSQRQPALADASHPSAPGYTGQAYLSWRAEGKLGGGTGEDLWLKRLDWNATTSTLTVSHDEVPLTRTTSGVNGDQRAPALANIPVPGGHALSMAWEDWARTFDGDDITQARPDIVVQVAPVPLRRGPAKERDCEYNACGIGEGPCTIDDDCAGSLVCAKGRGPWHGYGPDTAVCEPSTCSDGQRNAGEYGVDCGGECGPCFPCEGATSSSGTAHFCSAVCPCDNTEGDCDTPHDCGEGLECFEEKGLLMGLPEQLDLCLKPQCQDGIMNGEEDRVDCGDIDCVPCQVGVGSYCSTVMPCALGEGTCASNAECAVGNECLSGLGPLYGYPEGTGACAPVACATGRGAAFSSTACSAECKCGNGVGQCSSDADCIGSRCEAERGLYYSQDLDIAVCVPDQCFNGKKDGNETKADCGGPCGSECPVCPGDFGFRSFDYPANSSQPVGSRGWEYESGSGITWSKSTVANHGSESLQFSGCGEAVMRSPAFAASVFEIIGDELLVDLALVGTGRPEGIENNTSISLGLYNPITDATITLLETHAVANGTGEFVRQSIPLTGALSAVRELLASDATGLQFELNISFPCVPYSDAGQPVFVRLDHIRMGGGNPAFRSICPDEVTPPDPKPEIFGFEDVGGWASAQVSLAASTADKTEGSQAISAPATVNHILTSDVFSLGGDIPARLLLDVKLPPATGSLSGSVGMEITCGEGGTAESLGTSNISSQLGNGWRTLSFSIPTGLRDELAEQPSTCSFEITTNLTNEAAGSPVLYDNLRFAPDVHCNQYVQIAAAPFAVGMLADPDGTEDDPYRLCTTAQVETVMSDSSLWDKYFVLEADIDLSGVTGQIGNSTTAFSGTFDGNHHFLTGYERSGGNHSGLFARINGDGIIDGAGVGDGRVVDVTLADFIVSGAQYVGALVGEANKASISGVYVAGGSVTGAGGRVGGLAGYARNLSVIEGSVSTADVEETLTYDVGGLIGELKGSTVRDSRASGAVTNTGPNALSRAGGLVGYVNDVSVVAQSDATGTVIGSGSSVGGLIGAEKDSGTMVERCTAAGVTSGTDSVGGLVGHVHLGADVKLSQASGAVTGTGSNAGGLVGLASAASISDSSASGSVQGANQTGGLVGQSLASGEISRCGATGSVNGSANHAGGVVGWCQDTEVRDAYSVGSVHAGASSSGGVVGSYNHCTVIRAHAFGAVSGGGGRGTIAGADYDGTTQSSFQNSFGASGPNPGMAAVSGSPSAPGTSNLTAAQFRSSSNFTGWDFFSTWETGANYPELRKSSCQLYQQQATAPFAVGMAEAPNGTALRPYPLCTAAQVQTVMNTPSLWNSNFRLAADIDLTGVTGQIGSSTVAFRGTFDGGGHTLSNYTRNTPASSYTGLFFDTLVQYPLDDYLDGTIENLVIENFSISGSSISAALVGRNRGIVRNVKARGSDVTGASQSIGLVVGWNSSGLVEETISEGNEIHCGMYRCGGLVGYNAGAGIISNSRTVGGVVRGWNGAGVASYKGGLVGENKAVIEGCSSSALVEALNDSHVGGLIGYHTGAGAILTDSSSSGAVSGKENVGGLIGAALTSTTTVRGTASGTVDGQSNVGGVVGNMQSGSTMLDSSATGYVTATVAAGGGFVGYLGGASTAISGSSATGKVVGLNQIGGFAGQISGALVQDSRADGVVSATGSNIGGFVGYADFAVVKNARATGETSSSGTWVGGFVGNLIHGNLTDVAAIGDTKGNGVVGGLIGGSTGSSVTIRAVARGSVSSNSGSAGGLIAYFQGPSEVHHSIAYGDVEQISAASTGGLVGVAFQGAAGQRNVISGCEAHGDVSGQISTGGLVGNLAQSDLSDSTAFGRVKSVGSAGVGGLAGTAQQSVIQRSRATGTVSSGALTGYGTGGLLGQFYESVLLDSYSAGSVSGPGLGKLGGLIGEARASEVRRSYTQRGKLPTEDEHGLVLGAWLLDPEDVLFESTYGNSTENPGLATVAGRPTHAGVTALTEEQIQSQSSFDGWDFENTWQMSSKGPTLRSGYCTKNEQINTPPFVAGLDVLPTGDEESPYVLCTAGQMQALMSSNDSGLLGKYFELGESIDLSATNGRIGDATVPFTGSFDGRGYELINYAPTDQGNQSGLFGVVDGDLNETAVGRVVRVNLVKPKVLVTTATTDVGLLVGKAINATIEDIEIDGGVVSSTGTRTGGLVGTIEGSFSRVERATVNATVTGSTEVGGLVGRAQSSASIEEATTSGTVTATGGTPATAGGLVGYLDTATIWDAHSTAAVTIVGGSYAGGLLGQAHDAAVAVCSATGDVSGLHFIGGLIGYAEGTLVSRCSATGTASGSDDVGGLLGGVVSGSVTDSYATGAVSGDERVGGLVGSAQGASLERTYATGQVTATGTPSGALIGSVDAGVYLAGSFGNSTVNGGHSLVGNGTGGEFLTTTEFGDWSHFAEADWEYGSVWASGTNGPTLVAGANANGDLCFTYNQVLLPPFSEGMPVTPTGLADAPYPICTAAQLQEIIDTPALWDSHFALHADLNLSQLTGSLGVSSTQAFKGTFDGNGHRLTSFTRAGTADYQALFGYVIGDGEVNGTTDGHIHDLRLERFDVAGDADIGTLIGYGSNVLVKDIAVSQSQVSGAWGGVGGVIGSGTGRIHQVVSDVEVSSTLGFAGGVVGWFDGGEIVATVATTTLSTNSMGGGLVGRGNYARIYDSSSSGSVSCAGRCGGLLGSGGATVDRCGSTASVTGTGTEPAGGLIGRTFATLVVDSFATGDVQSSAGFAGGLIGDAYIATVERCYAEGTVSAASPVVEGALIAGRTMLGVHASAVRGSANPGTGIIGTQTAPYGVAVLTDTDAQTAGTFGALGWDVTSVWQVTAAGPSLLAGQGIEAHCIKYEQLAVAPFVAGMTEAPNGEAGNPYKLCTADQLQTVIDTPSLWNKHFVLEDHLDLYEIAGTIGTTLAPFTGSLDGQGHVLSSYEADQGLFDVVDGASAEGVVLQRLHAHKFDVVAGDATGALVGTLAEGTIRDITLVASEVSGTGANVGGLIGINNGAIAGIEAQTTVNVTGDTTGGLGGFSDGTIDDVVVDVDLSAQGGSRHGGVVGRAYGDVSNVKVSGTVNFTDPDPLYYSRIGGLVGVQEDGAVSAAEVRVNVTSTSRRAGGAVGQTTVNAVLTDVHTFGSIQGYRDVGGLVGYMNGGQLDECSATVSVVAQNDYAGGLTGLAELGAQIEDSWAAGKVKGRNKVGGLVGYILDDGASLYRSAAHADVFGSYIVGGLIGDGDNDINAEGRVEDCYSTGSVFATDERVGGVIGRAENMKFARVWSSAVVNGAPNGNSGAFAGINITDTSTFSSCYYDNDSSNNSAVGGGASTGITGGSINATRTASTFAGYDFQNVWEMRFDGPVLRNEAVPARYCETYTQTSTAPFVSGFSPVPTGEADKPYRICNPSQIANVIATSSLWNKHFVVEGSLDLNTTVGSIGNSTTAFSGVFDGQGHRIVNYGGSGGANSSLGLFGRVQGDGVSTGIIRNVSFGDLTATGTSTVGGAVGHLASGRVENVILATGTITGTGTNIGGIVGLADGDVVNSFSDANVSATTGTRVGGAVGGATGAITNTVATGNATVSAATAVAYVGGLAGYTLGADIIGSRAYGTVSSNHTDAGGLVGRASTGTIIEDSSAAGPVSITTSNLYAGGLVGRLDGTGTVVRDSSASGAVSGYQRVGGLIGTTTTGAVVEDSFATGNATGTSSSIGGLIGYANSTGAVTRSWASGAVSATSQAGGLIGYILAGSVVDSYAIGNTTVSSSTGRAGGLIGRAATATVTRCYSYGASDLDAGNAYTGAFIGHRESGTQSASYGRSSVNGSLLAVGTGSGTGVTLRTTSQFLTQSNFSGWNFTTVWIMGSARPELR